MYEDYDEFLFEEARGLAQSESFYENLSSFEKQRLIERIMKDLSEENEFFKREIDE